MKHPIAVALALIVVACCAVAVTAITVIRGELTRSVTLPGKTVVEILPGENSRKIASRLREAGLIGSERIFRWAALWRRADRAIRFGRHEFQGTVSVATILEELARAPKPILRVTIPEGLTLREIGALLEAAGAVHADTYKAVACSQELRRLVDSPPAASCGEGYLFPDTYDLVPGMSAGDIVDLQSKRFRQVADPLIASAGSDKASPLSTAPFGREWQPVAAIVTLASIVEKETAVAGERPHIAAVFYNRLRAGMPLQTDPTVIYGVIDSGLPWNGNLTRAHLETATPYNTYMRRGLPPGPICNPGRASIAAALHPAASGDLYFVARGDGSHEFNRDLASHNRAVRRYQLH